MLPILTIAALALPASASAHFPHTVAPGESLYSVAATDGLSVAQVAAANGLPLDAHLIAGSVLLIPPQTASIAPAAVNASAAGAVGDGDNDADDVGDGVETSSTASSNASSAVATRTASSSSTGSYVVQPGDTLTAIAGRAGISMRSLAAANGIDPSRLLVSGTVLRLSGAPTFVSTTTQSTAPTQSQPVGTSAQGNATSPPYPTPERLTAGQIGQIASTQGVSPSLADAIAWQESGFNNDLVSNADARGIMQILPGTWDWIQHSLDTGPALAPASASDNVRGGSIMLRWLLNHTGGDPALTAAGYYQGLPSVRQHGMYSDTQNYVHNILSLRRQFGGP